MAGNFGQKKMGERCVTRQQASAPKILHVIPYSVRVSFFFDDCRSSCTATGSSCSRRPTASNNNSSISPFSATAVISANTSSNPTHSYFQPSFHSIHQAGQVLGHINRQDSQLPMYTKCLIQYPEQCPKAPLSPSPSFCLDSAHERGKRVQLFYCTFSEVSLSNVSEHVVNLPYVC